MRLNISPTLARFIRFWVFAGLGLLGFTILIPRGFDFDVHMAAATKFLSGETRLYDSGAFSVFNAPWLLFILWPLMPLGPLGANLAWRVLNLTGLGLALSIFRGTAPRWAHWLAMISVPVFILLTVNNLDGFILLGIVLGWHAGQTRHPWLMGLSLWILSLKPQYVLLPTLMLLALVWSWRWRERWRAVAPVLFSLALSFLIFGFDWPKRYITQMQLTPPWPVIVTTVWHAANQLHISAWWLVPVAGLAFGAWVWAWHQQGHTRPVFLLALSTNLLFVIYALEPHYVLLIPVFLWLSERRPPVALLAYGLAWGIFALRLPFGWEYVWLGVLYALVLWVGTWVELLRMPNSTPPPTQSPV